MSIQHMAKVWEDSTITNHRELLILLSLADYSRSDGRSWPSMKSLAARARCSVRTVQRTIKSLCQQGKLSEEICAGPFGSNVYTVMIGGGDKVAGGVTVCVTGGVSQPCHQGGDKSSNTHIDDPSYNPQVPQKTDFDVFWDSYPRKVGKGNARKAFKKVKGKVDLPKILKAIAEQKKCPQWTKEGGQYIPHPSTWLNQERWEDEAQSVGNGSNGVSLGKRIQILEKHLANHPANRESIQHNKNVTDQEKEDYKRKKEQLALWELEATK